MTALTPGCDPDMSVSGAPFGAVRSRLRLRSGAVLLALATLCAYLVMGDAVPGSVAVPAAVVGLCSASALVMRGVRLVQHRGSAAAAPVARAAHGGSPAPAAP